MTTPKELETAIEKGNEPLRIAIEKLTMALDANSRPRSTKRMPHTVTRPAWTAEDADGECELTGTPVPTAQLTAMAGFLIHPNAARWISAQAAEQGIDPGALLAQVSNGDIELPTGVLSVPMEAAPVSERPPVPLDWKPEDLEGFSRAQTYQVAARLDLRGACAVRGIDYRREGKQWLIQALLWAAGHRDTFPTPENSANLSAYTASSAPPPIPSTPAPATKPAPAVAAVKKASAPAPAPTSTKKVAAPTRSAAPVTAPAAGKKAPKPAVRPTTKKKAPPPKPAKKTPPAAKKASGGKKKAPPKPVGKKKTKGKR